MTTLDQLTALPTTAAGLHARHLGDLARLARNAFERQARHHRRLLRQGHPNAANVGATLAAYNARYRERLDEYGAAVAAARGEA